MHDHRLQVFFNGKKYTLIYLAKTNPMPRSCSKEKIPPSLHVTSSIWGNNGRSAGKFAPTNRFLSPFSFFQWTHKKSLHVPRTASVANTGAIGYRDGAGKPKSITVGYCHTIRWDQKLSL